MNILDKMRIKITSPFSQYEAAVIKTQSELYDLIIQAKQTDKTKEQNLTEEALELYPDWDFAKENMDKLTEYWKKNYIEYQDDINPVDHKKICIFSHYETDKTISKSTLYWCKSLLEWDVAIIFVSTCENLSQPEIDKLLPYVTKIIIRPNQGYDFGGYCIGHSIAQQYRHHDYFILMNDSCFGPLYNLNTLDIHLPKGSSEIFGITNAPEPEQHLQSYFILFENTIKTMEILSDFFKQFIFMNNKEVLVKKYEKGISQFFISRNFSIKPMFPYQALKKQFTFMKRMIDPSVGFWRLLVRKLQCPFLKKKLFHYYHKSQDPFLKIDESINQIKKRESMILKKYRLFFYYEKDFTALKNTNPTLAKIIKDEMGLSP